MARRLKRSAPSTRLSTSQKKKSAEAPLEKRPRSVSSADLAAMDAESFLDHAIPMLRQVIVRQMKANKKAPQHANDATTRGRDSTALSGLVRTLEKLNALDTAREKKGKKGKAKDDAGLKEEFVRRLDQLLTARTTAKLPAKPEPG